MRPPNKSELTLPWAAYQYARDVVKGRWPEGEPAILGDVMYVVAYAAKVIKGRFPEGESTIAKDADYSCVYLMRVLKVIPERRLVGRNWRTVVEKWRQSVLKKPNP